MERNCKLFNVADLYCKFYQNREDLTELYFMLILEGSFFVRF